MPSWTRRIAPVVVALATIAGYSLVSAAPSLAASCGNQPTSEPFASYGDTHQYFLIPGGDFLSGGSGWTFTGGASVIADPVSPSGSAVNIPSGATVTTPPFCVTASDPVMRSFGYTPVIPPPPKHSKEPPPTMSVAVIYSTGTSEPVGNVPALSSWGATRSLSLSPDTTQFSNGTATVQYRFSAISGATWELDDIYADPRMLH